MSELRENNFLTSGGGTPPGCSGPVGSAAIASRADLQVSRKVFKSLDAEVEDFDKLVLDGHTL